MITFKAAQDHIIIYKDGEVSMVYAKQSEIIQLAKEALSGLVKVWNPQDPAGPAIDWVEQPALLWLVSHAGSVAARIEGAGNGG